MPIQIVNFTHLDAHIRLHAGGGRTASMVVEGKEKSPVELDNSVIPNSITWWNENESEQQRFDIGSTARRILSSGGVVTVELKTKKQQEMWKRHERESSKRPTRMSFTTLSSPEDPALVQLIHDLELSGEKFLDGQFDEDISFLNEPHALWVRPEIVFETQPQLFASNVPKYGKGSADLMQGMLGDCWVIATLAVLFSHDVHLIRSMIVTSRPRLGLYVVRFVKEAKAVYVVVDDRIPFVGAIPAFCHHADGTSMWGPIIEKAYAKLMGGYRTLIGGTIGYALTDFTGHLSHTVELDESKHKSSLHDTMMSFHRDMRNQRLCGVTQLVGCSIQKKGTGLGMKEQELSNGLFAGHAYAIEQIREVKLNSSSSIQLVELCNPWGRNGWKGDWSSQSSMWRRFPNVARSLGFDPSRKENSNNGTFWMSLEDFVRIFTVVEGVFYSARKLEHTREDPSASHNRHMSAVTSQWTSDTAGGAQGSLWRINPQFSFEWKRGNTSMLWISLLQSDKAWRQRVSIAQSRKVFARIGIQVWRLPSNGRRLLTPLSKYHVTASTYTPKRTISINLSNLPSGKYILIPTTYAPRLTGTFNILAMSSERIRFVELKRRDNDIAHSTKSFGLDMTFIEGAKKKLPAVKTKDPDVLEMWGSSSSSKNKEKDDIDALFHDDNDKDDLFGEDGVTQVVDNLQQNTNTGDMVRKVIHVPRDESHRLGIDFDNDTLMIMEVNNKAASRNGLCVGHRIVEIDGVSVKGRNDLVRAVQGKNDVNITVLEDPKRFAFINIDRSKSGRLGFDFNNSTLSVNAVKNKVASKMGLKPGQRIVTVDGKPVTNKDDLVRAVKGKTNMKIGVVNIEEEDDNVKPPPRTAIPKALSVHESLPATLSNGPGISTAADKRMFAASKPSPRNKKDKSSSKVVAETRKNVPPQTNRHKDPVQLGGQMGDFMNPELPTAAAEKNKQGTKNYVKNYRKYDSNSPASTPEIKNDDDSKTQQQSHPDLHVGLPPSMSEEMELRKRLKVPAQPGTPEEPSHRLHEQEVREAQMKKRQEMLQEEMLAREEMELERRREAEERALIQREELMETEENWLRRRHVQIEEEEHRELDVLFRREAREKNRWLRLEVMEAHASARAAHQAKFANMHAVAACVHARLAFLTSRARREVEEKEDAFVREMILEELTHRREIEERQREMDERKMELQHEHEVYKPVDELLGSRAELILRSRSIASLDREISSLEKVLRNLETEFAYAMDNEKFSACHDIRKHIDSVKADLDRVRAERDDAWLSLSLHRLRIQLKSAENIHEHMLEIEKLQHQKSVSYSNTSNHIQIALREARASGNRLKVAELETRLMKLRGLEKDHEDGMKLILEEFKSSVVPFDEDAIVTREAFTSSK